MSVRSFGSTCGAAAPETDNLAQAGDSEVEHLEPPIVGDHDVVRLQVAMNNTLLVRGAQRVESGIARASVTMLG